MRNILSEGMVDFLRKQHMEGSRIKLNAMADDPHPLPAGSTGKLDHIDDMGTYHVTWDNGRQLGVIPGVDDFEVRPPELKLFKLYMPMTVSRKLDSYGYDSEAEDYNEEYATLSNYEAAKHVGAIQAALLDERASDRSPGFLERGMMEYYDDADSVNRKVHSYQFNAEFRNNMLWGVAECMIYQDLTEEELDWLKGEITGQASDGFGEGFEQREIESDGCSLYAHLWSFDSAWEIKTEDELFGPAWLQDLPETCFSSLATSNEVIMLKKCEMGYLHTRMSASTPAEAAVLADHYNEKLGVTKAQEAAMKVGSMMGWHVPAANPNLYNEHGQLKEKEQPLSDRLGAAISRAAEQTSQNTTQGRTPEEPQI